MSVKRCVREEENRFGCYIVNYEENLIKGVVAAEIISTEDRISKKRGEELKQNWIEKKMNGLFVREILEKVDNYKTW